MLPHCAAGKDRSGFAAALLLHALAMSKNDIMQGYLLLRSPLAIREQHRIAGASIGRVALTVWLSGDAPRSTR